MPSASLYPQLLAAKPWFNKEEFKMDDQKRYWFRVVVMGQAIWSVNSKPPRP